MSNQLTGSKVHIISIGGGVMHSLGIALQQAGWLVTGSDDVIYSPSREALADAGLLPLEMGWDAGRVHAGLDCVILGMHARADNPEMLRAQVLGLPVYSYPEFISRYTSSKQRVVISGSHGKSTVTAMVMYTLRRLGIAFDYLIGAPLLSFERTVQLSDAPVIIIEGDEYPCSALDSRPKLLAYGHHIGAVTGIAWDHINFYTQEEDYVAIFEKFIASTPKSGMMVYNQTDQEVVRLMKGLPYGAESLSYKLPKYGVEQERTYLIYNKQRYWLSIFGLHNLLNIEAAAAVLKQLSVLPEECYEAMTDFPGVHQRLMPLFVDERCCLYRDYAHAPSKVTASVAAMRMQYPRRRLAAVLELHTFSSLDMNFTARYRDSLRGVDVPIIYIDPVVLAKRSEARFDQRLLSSLFNHKYIQYTNNKADIITILEQEAPQAVLFMSSGNFGGLDMDLVQEVLQAV